MRHACARERRGTRLCSGVCVRVSRCSAVGRAARVSSRPALTLWSVCLAHYLNYAPTLLFIIIIIIIISIIIIIIAHEFFFLLRTYCQTFIHAYEV